MGDQKGGKWDRPKSLLLETYPPDTYNRSMGVQIKIEHTNVDRSRYYVVIREGTKFQRSTEIFRGRYDVGGLFILLP